jgi:Tol biopolymer transport system component
LKLRRTLISAIIAVAAVTLVAATSASRVSDQPSLGKIAYTNFDARDGGFDVMLAGTDGSFATNITHDGTAMRNVDPNWSTDGTRVAYTRYNMTGGADIMVVNANGKGAVNLTGPSMRSGVMNVHPTWAPNGSIVFASNRNGNFDLYRIGIATSPTSSLVRMTKTAAPMQTYDPDYSADGKMLVFSRGTIAIAGGTAASLFTMAASPYALATKLTDTFVGLGDRGASWSPNGRQIAFSSGRAGNANLYLINRNGSGLLQLTSNKSSDSQPSWSPDGTKLVFLSDRTTKTELWMTSLVGMGFGEPVAWQITFDKQQKGAPDWQPLSAADRFPPAN